VGAEVQRLPEGAAVGAAGADGRAFGPWYRRQRELRGISVFYVAARTKLSPERVREIEEATAPLDTDGIGRATARVLAHAIGADPDEAAALLGQVRPTPIAARVRLPWLRERLLRIGRAAALAAVLGVALWLLGLWLSSPRSNASAPERIYKPDYVEKLLQHEKPD
jgi:transcriptional regulator with XRE-family HTH domain